MVACGGPVTGAPRLGPIMPAPFAAPQMRTSPPSTGIAALAVFMRVSVVMIACAKASACSAVLPTAAFSVGIAATIFSAGNGTPMMPVDDGTTSSKMHPKLSAAATQVAMHPAVPGAPFAQLALPAFTSTAPTRPPVDSRCRRPTVTGAATTRFEVYIAAPTAPAVATATATSRFPLALIPARTAPQTKPRGMVPAVKPASSFIPLLYQALVALVCRLQINVSVGLRIRLKLAGRVFNDLQKLVPHNAEV